MLLTDQADEVVHREHPLTSGRGRAAHRRIIRQQLQQRGHVCSGGEAITCSI